MRKSIFLNTKHINNTDVRSMLFTKYIKPIYDLYIINRIMIMFRNVDIAVINLDRRPDRMAYIHKNIPQFLDVDVDATNTEATRRCGGYRRFSAIDGTNLSRYYSEFHELLDTIRDSSRILGEVGCSLSHYSLWKEHALTPNAQYLLIFEDDVLFTESSRQQFNDVLRELDNNNDNDNDNNWDILYVGGQWTPNYDIDGEKTYFPFQRTTRYSLDTHYHYVRHDASHTLPSPPPTTTATIYKRRNLTSAVIQGTRNVWFTPLFRTAGAYLISQRGAKQLLEAVETDTALFMKTPLDMWLLEMDFRGYINAFDRFPHPFYQAGFELVKESSHIQNDIHRCDFQTVRFDANVQH